MTERCERCNTDLWPIREWRWCNLCEHRCYRAAGLRADWIDWIGQPEWGYGRFVPELEWMIEDA